MSRSVKRQKHSSPPAGYKDGEVKNGRVWVLHPTKGFCNLSARQSSVDERKLHPFVRYMRNVYRRMGKLV